MIRYNSTKMIQNHSYMCTNERYNAHNSQHKRQQNWLRYYL